MVPGFGLFRCMQNWAESMQLCQETAWAFLTASSVSTRTLLNMLVVTEPGIILHFYSALANFNNSTVKNQNHKQSSLISSLPVLQITTGHRVQEVPCRRNRLNRLLFRWSRGNSRISCIHPALYKPQLSSQLLFREKLTSPETVFLSMQCWRLIPFVSVLHWYWFYCIYVCLLRYCDWIKISFG